MGSRTRPDAPDSRTLRFLKASESSLEEQDFEECRKHALRAQESDPLHPGPAQLIAIVDVISAFSATISAAAGSIKKKSDYYAVLGLPRFTEDHNLIKANFEKLGALLNPNENLYPLSNHAFKLVCKAWRVLSNPIHKSQYDEELNMKLKSGNGSENRTSGADDSVISDPTQKFHLDEELNTNLKSGNGTEIRAFWTICTHCYHLHEYPVEYENCCMRCPNEKCRAVFIAAVRDPPAPEVIANGQYDCLPEEFTNGGKLIPMKNRKMAAKCSNKLMGKGVKVNKLNGSVPF